MPDIKTNLTASSMYTVFHHHFLTDDDFSEPDFNRFKQMVGRKLSKEEEKFGQQLLASQHIVNMPDQLKNRLETFLHRGTEARLAWTRSQFTTDNRSWSEHLLFYTSLIALGMVNHLLNRHPAAKLGLFISTLFGHRYLEAYLDNKLGQTFESVESSYDDDGVDASLSPN